MGLRSPSSIDYRFTIRRATADDAELYSRAHVAALHETYAHLMPRAFHEHYDAELPLLTERRRAALANNDVGYWLALDPAGQPVGVVSSGPGRDEDRPDFELHHLYTLSSTHGTGLGQRLLDLAVGSSPAYLWILNENPRAERFYRRNGFQSDGTTALCGPVWHHRPMFRMHRTG
ncbi:GNAT family N-acetyltransferase [Arthrobacter sp. JZ12]|uniref:GNAT family N-acetyltransferase n=1 Tax=Arthrobacter sp. JZ12 TaxID=2654190 RepID=UPI002B4AAC16|nr:GNAT family N-acetyltransferase [Arthrobacter sp. JZ12]WRH23791.1 GNAT family N-acetyltransferase [Arthrobacter sp. JZ12]